MTGMSDRPSTPSGPEPEVPSSTERVTPAQADDTAVLPQQPVARPETAGPTDPAGPADVHNDPAGPADGPTDAAVPTDVATAATTQTAPSHPAPSYPAPSYPAPSYAAPHHAGAAGPPPRPPQNWWGQATSTGGGKAALVTAGVLGAVLLLAGVALLGGLVGRAADWGRHDRIALTEERSGRGWMAAPGQRELGRERGGQRERGEVGPGMPGPRDGMGMNRGGLALLGGGVLHGEFTTSVNGTPTVMVVQTGEVTTYTSGRSLTVRSSDGFEATYSLDDSVVTDQVTARLATGAQVRVVAAKEGMKVTRLAVVS